MKLGIGYLLKQRNYPHLRTAIEAKILFAARITQMRFLGAVIKPVHPCTGLIARFAEQNALLLRTTDIRVGNEKKTPREQNSSGKKIEAVWCSGADRRSFEASAVPILVYFYIIIIVHKYRQSAKERCLLKRNTVPEVFPLTAGIAGSGETMPFEKRRSRYKETAENKAEAYRVYVEHLFSACDAVDARIFSKGEMDEETGLYYYGARYLDPKYSRWLSGDPALSDYIPKAPIDDEAKKHNENLPGMGGVFNVVNLHLYHYAGNNPVKYTDPDGKANKPILNLHTPKSKDFTYSNGFKIPENTFVVAAHGNVYGVYDHRGNESHRVKPKELAAMIKSHPGYKNGMTVMLLVCNVGLPGPDGTISAQQIADAMGEGERVRAPEGFVNMYQHPFGRKKGQIDYFVQKKGEPIDTLNTELKEFIGKPKKEEVKE